MWYVYFLFNEEHNKYYIGITNNLEKRLLAHNSGVGAKATRMYKNWRYVYYESCIDKSDSLKKEYLYKKMSHKQKVEFVHAKQNV